MQSLIVMQELIDRLPARLQALPSDKVEHKPAPDAWSAKEELGHLLDSAANNHQRIVRAQLEDKPAMPGYDGDAWVALHCYHDRDWHSLIER
jgi:DinB superfamily